MSHSFPRGGVWATTLTIVCFLAIPIAIVFVSAIVRDTTRRAFFSGQTSESGISQHALEFGVGLSDLPYDTHSFTIRNVIFTVKQPVGFVLLDDSTALAQIVHPPDNKLHLVFITEVDKARIMNGDSPAFDRYVAVQSNRKLDSNSVTSEIFAGVKSRVRSRDVLAIPQNQRIVNEFLDAKGQHVDEVKVIGFAETADSFSLTCLVKQRGQKARVNAVTMRNLCDCCIVVATTAVCRNQDDIDWSKTATADCTVSLGKN